MPIQRLLEHTNCFWAAWRLTCNICIMLGMDFMGDYYQEAIYQEATQKIPFPHSELDLDGVSAFTVAE